jgi:hypothetical protein
MKKFEEGVFSDLRNLKPGADACLEEPKVGFSFFDVFMFFGERGGGGVSLFGQRQNWMGSELWRCRVASRVAAGVRSQRASEAGARPSVPHCVICLAWPEMRAAGCGGCAGYDGGRGTAASSH